MADTRMAPNPFKAPLAPLLTCGFVAAPQEMVRRNQFLGSGFAGPDFQSAESCRQKAFPENRFSRTVFAGPNIRSAKSGPQKPFRQNRFLRHVFREVFSRGRNSVREMRFAKNVFSEPFSVRQIFGTPSDLHVCAPSDQFSATRRGNPVMTTTHVLIGAAVVMAVACAVAAGVIAWALLDAYRRADQ